MMNLPAEATCRNPFVTAEPYCDVKHGKSAIHVRSVVPHRISQPPEFTLNAFRLLLASALAAGLITAPAIAASIVAAPGAEALGPAGARLRLDPRLHLGPVFDGIVPAVDLSGTWSNGGVPVRIRQKGSDLTFTYTKGTADFVFTGRFVSPTVVVGRYAPYRDPVANCTTTSAVRIDISDDDAFLLRSRVLTTSCARDAGHADAEAPFARLCVVCFDTAPVADRDRRRSQTLTFTR